MLLWYVTKTSRRDVLARVVSVITAGATTHPEFDIVQHRARRVLTVELLIILLTNAEKHNEDSLRRVNVQIPGKHHTTPGENMYIQLIVTSHYSVIVSHKSY